jgi:cell division cycle 2-like protein
MASKAKSRWADDEADAALEAQLKKEKEEKKRLRAEEARKLEAEKQTREAAAAAAAQQNGDAASGPPAKRRKISPERDATQAAQGADAAAADAPKLLRFNGGSFGRCRSVENYDKLNDIEEGAYGWVSRAKEMATGKVVALKRLKIDPKDRGGLPVTGLREIQILKDCDHRNVVQLREVVVGDDTSTIEKYCHPPQQTRPC